MLDQITPLILTYNEEKNIARSLAKLIWATRIIVVDSGSDDRTLEILDRYPQVETLHRPFVDFATQCNYGLRQVTTPWTLSLDADYELTDELVSEMASLDPAATTVGYRAQFIYRIHGRALRGSLYPPRVVMFRSGQATYLQEGHAHRLQITGDVLPFRGRIYHDDRKPLSRWVASQRRYAAEEADYLLLPRTMAWPDGIRRLGWLAPLAVLLHTLIVKGCVLDGWAGWYYAMQRCVAETLLALELIDRRLRADATTTSAATEKKR